jgi:hypothetical protein
MAEAIVCRRERTILRTNEADAFTLSPPHFDAGSCSSHRKKVRCDLLSPLSFARSPSVRTSKGFLIVGHGVTPSSEQFDTMSSGILRFAALAASSHHGRSVYEISDAFTAND